MRQLQRPVAFEHFSPFTKISCRVTPTLSEANARTVSMVPTGTVVPGGSAENPLKARWMGFWDGAGIHGTAESSSIGSAASHGCIRMLIPDVIELYDQVPVGAPIYIA